MSIVLHRAIPTTGERSRTSSWRGGERGHAVPTEPAATKHAVSVAPSSRFAYRRRAHGPRAETPPYSVVIPPSTVNVAPVAKAASSLARNAMMPATSSGVPARPTGIRPTIAARASGSSLIVVTSDVSV